MGPSALIQSGQRGSQRAEESECEVVTSLNGCGFQFRLLGVLSVTGRPACDREKPGQPLAQGRGRKCTKSVQEVQKTGQTMTDCSDSWFGSLLVWQSVS